MRAPLIALLFFASASLAGETLVRFDGSANTRTPVFEPPGAWMLDWSTRSDNTLPKLFELRLHNADTGEILGTIVLLRELSSGRKLFEDGGRYQVDVVAANLDWSLVVSLVESDEAGRLKRRSEGAATIEDSTVKYARQVSEDSFASWRPIDDQTLLLFAAGNTHGYRITFAHPCSGLSKATALMFVAASYGSGGEIYDAIMLDDGTHCPFERVIPTVFD